LAKKWDKFFASISFFDDDFLAERDNWKNSIKYRLSEN
jgi:hypothetical protein